MTNQQKALVADALSNCMVIGNKINFFKNFTSEEIKLIYAGLTEDILSYNIPHNRVVGIKYPRDNRYTTSVIKRNGAFNDSVIKFALKCADIVPLSIGGNDKELQCYQASNTPIFYGDNKENFAILREPAKIPDWKKRKIRFEYNPDELGQLMYIIGNVDKGDKDAAIMSTRTMRFRQFEIESAKTPNYLINNVELADITYTDAVLLTEITLFYCTGTGVLDFSQTADFFNNDSGVFPCRTTFDLGRFFTIRYPKDETDGLTIYSSYGDNLNTFGLTDILKNYAKGLVIENGN